MQTMLIKHRRARQCKKHHPRQITTVYWFSLNQQEPNFFRGARFDGSAIATVGGSGVFGYNFFFVTASRTPVANKSCRPSSVAADVSQ
jgi:hypothetical protein